MSVPHTIKGKLNVLRNIVLVERLESGSRTTKGGIFIVDDNMKDQGIRSRWGKVFAIGPDVTEIAVGQWVRVEHGRWTMGFVHEDELGETRTLHRIDWPDKVDLVCDEFPDDMVPNDWK